MAEVNEYFETTDLLDGGRNIFLIILIVTPKGIGLSNGLLLVKAQDAYAIYYNVVNGVGTGGDQWGYITAVSIGTPQVKSEEASIHELGVSLFSTG